MTTFNNIKLDQQDGILTITINRASKMNALNIETVKEIKAAMQEVYDEDEIKGVIFTGDGEKAFVAGADIAEIAELNEVVGRRFAERGQETFDMIEYCNKPVIAAINGFALGGGCELAMACHIRIAADNARFGQPEVNLGIIPGYGGTQRLTQLVGKGKALELMMTGDQISAQEAKTLGLVNHVVSTRDELTSLANSIMNKIVSKGPLAIANVIKSVNAGFGYENAGYIAEAEN